MSKNYRGCFFFFFWKYILFSDELSILKYPLVIIFVQYNYSIKAFTIKSEALVEMFKCLKLEKPYTP